jgi:hypothetical protein
MSNPKPVHRDLGDELLRTLAKGPMNYDELLQTTSRSPAAAYRSLAKLRTHGQVRFVVYLSKPAARPPEKPAPVEFGPIYNQSRAGLDLAHVWRGHPPVIDPSAIAQIEQEAREAGTI